MANFSPSKYLFTFLLGATFLLFSQNLFSQTQQNGNWNVAASWTGGIPSSNNNVTVNHTITIPAGYTARVNDLVVGNNGRLIVEGNLIVNGSLEMTNTSLAFEMGEFANVIVFGDFVVKNQVNISLSSLLIVYGDFTKNGGQGTINIDDANIYIIGSATGWPNSFSCDNGEYQGTTPNVNENCDFGDEQDLIDNQDQFPDEIIDFINCYDLSSISGKTTCPGGSATLSIINPNLVNVSFEWQEKLNDDWRAIGNSSSLTLSNIQNFEKEYRVIVRPTLETSTCKISISRSVKIQANNQTSWTGTSDANWNNPANWSCGSLPTLSTNVTIPSGTPNAPILQNGDNGMVKDLTLQTGAVLTVINKRLSIAGNLNISGNFNVASGTVALVGTSAQIIPQGVFSNDLVQDLIINNAAGVTSAATIHIINSLLLESGNLETGENLKLLSTASRTAFIHGTGTGTTTGTVQMQRHLSNGFGYKYFSSPFSNSTVGDFSGFMELSHGTTGFPHFYEYREDRKYDDNYDLSGWQAYLESGNTLNIAEGYALNISGVNDPVTIEISGEVNHGDVNIALQNSEGLYTNGFNLVGNPYPSPIDWSLIIPTLNGIDDAVYFFNAGSDDRYTGTYSSYVNGVYTNATTSIIPSMQGFFVRVSDPGTATLSFTNAVRTGNQINQNFYRSKNPRVIPQIKLAAGFSGENTLDATVIYFHQGATTEFEKDLDALKLLNTTIEVPSLYSLTKEQEKLSINAVSSTESREIPLGIRAEKAGKMFIQLANVENIFPSAYVYLKDRKNKLMHDFSEEPVYSFTSQKGEINDRFFLILSTEKLSENELRSNLEYFSVRSTEGELYVKLNLPENTSGNVILSNISGQVLQKRSGKEKEEFRFSGITAPGVYLVSLEFEKERQTKKILIKK